LGRHRYLNIAIPAAPTAAQQAAKNNRCKLRGVERDKFCNHYNPVVATANAMRIVLYVVKDRIIIPTVARAGAGFREVEPVASLRLGDPNLPEV